MSGRWETNCRVQGAAGGGTQVGEDATESLGGQGEELELELELICKEVWVRPRAGGVIRWKRQGRTNM